MTAFNRRPVFLFVRRNQIIIDLVLIHKVKAFSFYFLRRFLPHISVRTYSIFILFFLFDRTLEALITLPL